MKSEFEKLTFEDLLNWLDRPEGAMLELYPHEVKECREMLTEFKQDLNKAKQELEEYRILERALRYASIMIYSISHRTDFLEDDKRILKGIDNVFDNLKKYAREDILKEREEE